MGYIFLKILMELKFFHYLNLNIFSYVPGIVLDMKMQRQKKLNLW